MADIADVMDALEEIVLEATFPEGTDKPCILHPRIVSVGQGWPLASDLDKVRREERTLVSIYAVPSSTSETDQPFNNEDQIVEPAGVSLTSTVSGDGFMLVGSPVSGEYVSVDLGLGRVYDVTFVDGDTSSTMAARLAAQIAADYPDTTYVGSGVMVSPTPPRLNVRHGGKAKLARRIHRQRSQFRVTVWSHNPADRALVARTVDTKLKSSNVVRLPDTSQALVTYMNTNLDDKFENEGIYRRDLIFNVTYDTIEFYDAYVVTTVVTDLVPTL